EIARRVANVRLLQTANRGVSAARNTLIEAASADAEFITFLDADDAYPLGRLAYDLALFDADPTLEVVYGRIQLVENHDVDLRAAVREDDVMVKGINVAAGLFRRRLIEQTGLFDTSLTHGEDLDYLLRIFETSPRTEFYTTVGLLYRQHPDSATKNRPALMRGVMKAMLLHRRRLRADPSLVPGDGLFDLSPMEFVELGAEKRLLPAYSVVIPAYNAAVFLRETVLSVATQTHPPAQIIVVDDGSTDHTRDVLLGIPARLKVIHQDNHGPGAATNAGIAEAVCDYIAFLDADDRWLPAKIEEQLAYLVDHPDVDGVFCRSRSFSAEDVALAVDDAQSGWSRSTLLVKREVFDRVGLIADLGRRAGEMIDWFARAREAGVVLEMLDVALAERRLHAGSLTANAENIQHDYLAVVKEALRRKRKLRNDQQ
ncbi:MAG: glycosyltransferase, partial [Deltaproteobacteria bacterium]